MTTSTPIRHLLASCLVAAWTEIESEVIEGFFRFSPGYARVAGDHRFDGRVGDASRTGIDARVEEIERQLAMIRGLNLRGDEEIDRRALVAQLEASRFELTELRFPFVEPMFYAGFGTELDVSSYLKRPYAPIGERLAALRQHLSGYGGYLEAARDNLDVSLPRPNLEIAIEAVDGQTAYLDGEVREAARDQETAAVLETAIDLTRSFADYLKAKRATANDNFALGEERFLRLLRLRELVDLDVAALERMVRSDIERNRAAAEAAAQQVLPGAGVAAALERLQDQHPTSTSLINDVAGMLDGLRRFLLERDLVSIPEDGRCLVRPTPSYAAYISAAMDNAGPLEAVATDSYYYVTVPGPDWSPQQRDEWLRYLNYAMLEGTSIHEAYPGHYLQGLHERRSGSSTRRLFWTYSTGEGFAHYGEEMMLEAGYSDDPRLHLGQRLDALLRDCRFLAAIGLHCRGMTVPEAVRLFEANGFLSELPATREATRGTWDPMYLCYTLGKLLILQLRDDLKRRPGFSLKGFHDAFLGCGAMPIPLIRELIA
jgi:Bacterial protein of unknown function (DUF885)